MLAKYKYLEWQCNCKQHERIQIEKVVIEQGALQRIASYLSAHDVKHVLLVADVRTYKAAGAMIEQLFHEANITCTLSMIEDEENGDIIANEQAISQVLIQYEAAMDMLLAVGAGTIHDIVRFVSNKVGKRFISVPTAASVDGFTSAGAPLVIKGFKQTYQACSPLAIFADSDVLVHAPQEMTAAGFADMLAKYTSLFDWELSHLFAAEPYCPQIAQLTNEALQLCVQHVEEIAAGSMAGVEILMQALCESGIAMLLAGHSRPASGAEHHLSHYWEMDFIKTKKRQVLHGAKVGVSSIIITRLYTTQLLNVILGQQNNGVEGLVKHRHTLQKLLGQLPRPEQLERLLKRVGAPIVPQQLGIDDTLVEQSLKQAVHLRNRYTGLKCLNELGQL